MAAVLEASGKFAVVERLSRGDDAPEIARRSNADIAVLDIEMPGRSAFDTARAILAASPGTRIAFLTGHAHSRFAREARELGAHGFLSKAASTQIILDSLERIAQGETVVVHERMSENGSPSPAASLSPRELEVLKYIAQGLSTREMAETMFLSPRTVERHVERLMARLGIRDRLRLALFAFAEGLATPPGMIGPVASRDSAAG